MIKMDLLQSSKIQEVKSALVSNQYHGLRVDYKNVVPAQTKICTQWVHESAVYHAGGSSAVLLSGSD